MARLRSAPPKQQPVLKEKSRQPLKETTNITQARTTAYMEDGNIEDLVKDSKRRKGRPRKAQHVPDDLLMASGLGTNESGDAHATCDPPTTTDELAKSDNPPLPFKPNKRPPRATKRILQNEKHSKVLDGLKKRMEATARGQKVKEMPPQVRPGPAVTSPTGTASTGQVQQNPSEEAVAERSTFSISPTPSPPRTLRAASGKRTSVLQPGSVFRAQATPAVERSLLALKNFKRRPRQPSMLQMVQQRTASARPSLANTAVEDTDAENTSEFDLGLEVDGEEDFAPEAEGTPLHAAKLARMSSTSSRRALSSAVPACITHEDKAASSKRKSTGVNDSSSSLAGLMNKRHKSDKADLEELQSELPMQTIAVSATESSPGRPEMPLPPLTSDVQVLNSPSSSTPPSEPSPRHNSVTSEDEELVIHSTERNESRAEPAADGKVPDERNDQNETMADPLSSSPPRDNASLAHYLAYPVTQTSPTAPKGAKPPKKPRSVSTAVLQSLLPKKRAPLRQRHRKSEYDVESDSDEDVPLDASHLDEDEDELGGRLRRQAKQVPIKRAKKTGGRRGRPAKPSIASMRETHVGLPSKTTQKTYARTASSDKENDGYESQDGAHEDSTLPDVSLSMHEVAKSKELEAAKRRFAEVDQWEMEFECISDENHRSSSQGWR